MGEAFRSAVRRTVFRLLARRRLFPVFEGLGRLADAGMNRGNVDHPATSGELHVLDLLDQPSTIVDVGANRGEYANAAKQRHPGSRVIAVDPALSTLSGVLAPGVESVPLAAGAQPGSAWLFAPAPGSKLGRVRSHAVPGSTEVEVTTLDALCADRGIDHVDLLKIDVEGGELDVLEGARGLLEVGAIGLVQFEFGLANLARGHTLAMLLDRLAPRQLHAVLVDGVRALPYHERLEVGSTRNLLAVPP